MFCIAPHFLFHQSKRIKVENLAVFFRFNYSFLFYFRFPCSRRTLVRLRRKNENFSSKFFSPKVPHFGFWRDNFGVTEKTGFVMCVLCATSKTRSILRKSD